MDLQSIGISNAFTAPCFYSFQHAHAGGLQIHPNVRECLLMTYRVDIIRRTHVIYLLQILLSGLLTFNGSPLLLSGEYKEQEGRKQKKCRCITDWTIMHRYGSYKDINAFILLSLYTYVRSGHICLQAVCHIQTPDIRMHPSRYIHGLSS